MGVAAKAVYQYGQLLWEQHTIPTTGTIYRINAGGAEIAALDGGIPFGDDTSYIVAGTTTDYSYVDLIARHSSLPDYVPTELFQTEVYDRSSLPEMQWQFPIGNGDYEIRLFIASNHDNVSAVGSRVFDILINGVMAFDNFDPVEAFGHDVAGMISTTVTVTTGYINIEFIHVVENPLVNGIEILSFTGSNPTWSETVISNYKIRVNNDYGVLEDETALKTWLKQ